MSDFDKRYNSIANGFLLMWVLCFFTPLGLFMWFFYSNHETMPQEINDWGVVGDFVGGLSNPIISTMTFMALIFTILQNQKVLKLTEEELAETRKEIEMTRKANEYQAEEFKTQNYLAVKQAELQSTVDALLKTTELVNRSWNKPTDIPINHPAKDGSMVSKYYSLHDMTAPGFGIDPKEFGSDLIPALSEVMTLLTVHKKLLERMHELSPNNPMIESVSWLVKEPMGWIAENTLPNLSQHQIAVIGELKPFYSGLWEGGVKQENYTA